MLLAILVGNAAYEAGNISGGVLGLETILGGSTVTFNGFDINFISISIGIIAFIVLYIGNYKILERSLVTLVLLMSLSFLLAAFLTAPDFLEVLKGIFIPSASNENILTIIGLVGTTVVPYNLFLHANLVKEKWNGSEDLKKARTDLYVSILLGGLVSIGIIICGASIQQGEIQNAVDLAIGLEPLYGSFSKYMLSVGLFAAGITSAITAPLAAAYVARECFGWEQSLRSKKFRSVWMFVVFLGVLFSSVGIKPIEIIQVAQVANGILLPIIAGFLLWVVNKKSVLGEYKNGLWQNIFGFLIVAAALILGAKGILKVFY
jgi:Mn2+/Fe2+ NRAMP family transporter